MVSAVSERYNGMKLMQHVTMPKLIAAWMLLLMLIAVTLPTGGSHTAGVLAKSLLGLAALLLLFTPVVVFMYFKRHWRAAIIAQNRNTYVAWISLQTITAVGCLFGII